MLAVKRAMVLCGSHARAATGSPPGTQQCCAGTAFVPDKLTQVAARSEGYTMEQRKRHFPQYGLKNFVPPTEVIFWLLPGGGGGDGWGHRTKHLILVSSVKSHGCDLYHCGC